MAECGICLEILRSPVSIPCGHVHCERCLRSHINSGSDAFKSTCPTCRKAFHIASPDFTFVPQKYHDFILPSVRRVYMDIPSLTTMAGEIDILTRRVEALTKERDHYAQRSEDCKSTLNTMVLDKMALKEQVTDAREEAADLRAKYVHLKAKYWDLQSRGNASPSLSRRSSQNFDTSRELLPKVEEHPVSLQDLTPPPRPKRALPRSRLSSNLHLKDEQSSQIPKRQRTHRHSDIGPSSQQLRGVFKGEGDDE